jgi:hypothetical protein
MSFIRRAKEETGHSRNILILYRGREKWLYKMQLWFEYGLQRVMDWKLKSPNSYINGL